ncbi:MAG: hypothetical protein JNL36_11450 [Candidatus Kapabacteria bacterium]|nr:hypothetical protein [Candidatus Kapabacteria bacterium]
MIEEKIEIDSLFFELPFEEIITFCTNLIHLYQIVTPTVITSLRKSFPGISLTQQQIILDIVLGSLRGQRLGKFPKGWYVTSILAEQATHMVISDYHGSKFKGIKTALEICTGSANDTVALAKNVKTVHTFENNYLHYLLAQQNSNKIGINNVHFHFGDIENADISTIPFSGLWADPSRRDTLGQRKFTVAGYSPSLEFLVSLSKQCEISGIKVSPSIHHPIEIGWIRDFVGFEKECKEEILWKKSDSSHHCLTLIEPFTQWFFDEELEISRQTHVELQEGMYLYEPHSILVRSKQTKQYYSELGITSLDKESVYGVSNNYFQLEMVTVFRILSIVPYKTKEIQKVIDTFQWNERTEVKKRNFPYLPEEIQKDIRFSTDSTDYGVLICTRHNGKLTAIFARRVAAQ